MTFNLFQIGTCSKKEMEKAFSIKQEIRTNNNY